MHTAFNSPTKSDYVRIILRIVETDGLEVADTVNHRALATKLVTLDWFQAAARELANIILNRN